MPRSQAISDYYHPRDWLVGLQRYIIQNPVYAELLKIFPYQPEAFLNAETGLHYHMTIMTQCRYSYDEKLRNMIISAILNFQKEELKLPTFHRMRSDQTSVNVNEMSELGYSQFSAISKTKIDDIKRYLLGKTLVPSYLTDVDERISLADAKRSLNVGYYHIDQVLNCPHIMEIANNPHLLAIVEEYLGVTPTLINPTIWWSFSGRNQEKDAQLFHFDNDDYRFCKLFIYLTDVDYNSGPHVFFAKTHRVDVIKKIRDASSCNTAFFDDWYLKTLRKSDKDALKILNMSPKYFIGEAGAQFLVDTSGIHKGELPQNKDRLVCQFTYGVLPKPLSNYCPRFISRDSMSPIPPRIYTQLPYSYVNRIFLSNLLTLT